MCGYVNIINSQAFHKGLLYVISNYILDYRLCIVAYVRYNLNCKKCSYL